MRRTFVSVLGVVFGTALLVGLKSQAFSTPTSVTVGAPQDPGASSGTPPGPARSGSPDAGLPSPTPGPTGTTPKPGRTTPQPSGTTSTTTAPPASRTITGAAISVRTAESPNPKSGICGECHDYAISVTITVAGGRITSASYSYSTSPGGSQLFADRATHTLIPMVVSAQTWSLGKPVSGATYSVNATELSTKDAMSRAGL
jgi:hypothetical protein